MTRIDLNAARARRREKRRREKGDEFHYFEFGHRLLDPGNEDGPEVPDRFDLPVELPAEFAFIRASEGLYPAFRALLGNAQFVRFMSHEPSTDDVDELMDQISPIYGLGDAGESSDSGEPSPTTGEPSSPTSSGSTASISPISSGATPPTPTPDAVPSASGGS